MTRHNRYTSGQCGLRVYRHLLWLYPRSFRAEYEQELLHVLRESVNDHHFAGPGRVVLFWIGTYVDLVSSAYLERWEQTMDKFHVVRWSGPLAILGGALWALAIAAVSAKFGDSSQWLSLWDTGVVAFAAALAITGAMATLIPREDLMSTNAAVSATAFSGLGALSFFGGVLTDAWYVVAGRVYALMVATLIAGTAMLIRRGSSEWSAWLLVIASALMFLMNSENWQMWLGVPFGIAWMAFGYRLWMSSGRRMLPAH